MLHACTRFSVAVLVLLVPIAGAPVAQALSLESVQPAVAPFVGGTPVELRGEFQIQFNTGPLQITYQVYFTPLDSPAPDSGTLSTVQTVEAERIRAITRRVPAPGMYNVFVRATNGVGAAISNGLPFTMEPARETELGTFARTLSDNFAFFDTNGDGGLSLEEAQQIPTQFGEADFRSLDANNDGILTPLELEAILRREILRFVMGAFPEVDADGNGVLSRAEFFAVGRLIEEDWVRSDFNRDQLVSLLETRFLLEESELLCADSLEAVAAVLFGDFDLFDANGNGQVTPEEVRNRACPNTSALFLQTLTLNGDGAISREELAAVAANWLLAGAQTPQSNYSFSEAVGALNTLHFATFLQLDINRDGMLSLTELGIHVARTLLENFEALDTNGNGALSMAELLLFLPFTKSPTMAALDLNVDGSVNQQELRSLLNLVQPPATDRGCQCGKAGQALDVYKLLSDLLLAGLAVLTLHGFCRPRG